MLLFLSDQTQLIGLIPLKAIYSDLGPFVWDDPEQD